MPQESHPNADGAGDLLTAQAGEVLFRAGDIGSSAFFIEEGHVELLADEGGKRLALLGPGEFFGESSALAGGPRRCCARAKSAARLLCVDAATLVALVEARPELALALLRQLATRLENALLTVPDSPPMTGTRVVLLHAESGKSFPLPDKAEVIVGRAVRGASSRPDLDLSSIDPECSLSRPHARLRRDGDTFVLTEEPDVTNGSWVQGRRLEPGEEHVLGDGEEFQLGLVTLSIERR